MFVILFFFFKQKTAYEMRISDWSSDVCSSDLQGVVAILRRRVLEAIDLGHVELEPGMEGDTVRGLSAHSFRVGLTQDLFAAGEDGSGIALALRWSSPTTALRYARELAVGNNAAARVLGRLRDSEAPTVARSTANQ